MHLHKLLDSVAGARRSMALSQMQLVTRCGMVPLDVMCKVGNAARSMEHVAAQSPGEFGRAQ
jgi:hypothetical protein